MKKLFGCILIFFIVNGLVLARDRDYRISILPIKDISREKQYGWIGKGIAETMTQALSCVSSVKIVEREQLGQVLKEQELSLTGLVDEKKAVKIGSILNANRILIGSFQVEGRSILVSIRIVNVETGEIDKSKMLSSKGNVDKIFDLYEDLTTKFIEKFGIHLEPKEKQNISTVLKSTNTPSALKEYINGRESMLAFTLKDYIKAKGHFENAVIDDPRYALAYAALAEVNALIAYERRKVIDQIKIHLEPEKNIKARKKEYRDIFISAQGAARTAVSLAPDLPEAHRALALIYYYMNDYVQAKIEAQTLLALNRNDPYAYYLLGSMDDDPERGLKFINKALQINPNFGEAYRDIGYYYITKNELKKAAESYEKGIRISPLNTDLRRDIGILYVKMQKYHDAVNNLEKVLKYRKDDAYASLCCAIAYFKTGKRNKAYALFKNAYSTNWQLYSSPSVLKEKYNMNKSMLKDWFQLRNAESGR